MKEGEKITICSVGGESAFFFNGEVLNVDKDWVVIHDQKYDSDVTIRISNIIFYKPMRIGV